jgi:hypothetical protein
MPEPVLAWWARRQRSKGADVPYAVGTYRADWKRYPALVRQYHPDLNGGITLTQVPPGADVLLLWVCDVGHRFVATPDEQRSRPGGTRRRSSWCPECAELARPRRIAAPRDDARWACGHRRDPRLLAGVGERCPLCVRLDGSAVTRELLLTLVLPGRAAELSEEVSPLARYRWTCDAGHPSFEASVERVIGGRRCPICRHARDGAGDHEIGEAFVSRWAPKPASAAEPQLRRRLAERLEIDLAPNAVRVARPFFGHLEVWPDILLEPLRVAIEYDTTGRSGLEHLGRKEQSDRRKDRLLRAAGWEVVRVRCGGLAAIGPWDLLAASVSDTLADRVVERLGEIRGELYVRSYVRPRATA